VQSFFLLLWGCCMLAVPGVAASLAFFPPGELSIVTRSAAAFGLGYAVSGGCAFVLSAMHFFRLGLFIPVWLAASALLWFIALRRSSLRDHARAIISDIHTNAIPLLLGGSVVAAVLIARYGYIYVAGGPRYVYYLNGIEIANSHGVPSATLEYGQLWPPATDKILLDAFTGVFALVSHNSVIGPGVLLWVSALGSALGLWASAWELGLRRTGGLLPLVVLGNRLVLYTTHSLNQGYINYRAEDFGRAVAFCALALGIVAIREGGWRRAVVAGIVLGAASGSHLVPVVVVVIALCSVGVAELLRDQDMRARFATLRYGVALAAIAGSAGIVIRVFAGGSFGLGGASNQSTYAAIPTSFDPTAYLYAGSFRPLDPPESSHWYMPPRRVIENLLTQPTGIHWTGLSVLLLFAGALLAAILLFWLVPTDLRTVGVVGLGVMTGVVCAALFFAYRYHVYINATFGVRRLAPYMAVGLALIGLGVVEALLVFTDRLPVPLPALAALVPVVLLTAWMLPSTGVSPRQERLSRELLQLTTWVRTQTPCGARFLVNQRPEGTMTALTGRVDLSEGMGPFLRVNQLPYVVNLMLGARNFYASPLSNESFLRQHNISYVVVSKVTGLIGYSGPIGETDISALNAAPFLQRMLETPGVLVYKVVGAHVPPVSPLLKGPYLHCIKEPAHF
jgi:hypothetical protein